MQFQRCGTTLLLVMQPLFFCQITIMLTYSFRLCVDCNVGAPRGIAHGTLRKSRRSTHKLRLQGSQSLYGTSNRCLLTASSDKSGSPTNTEDLDKVKSRLIG